MSRMNNNRIDDWDDDEPEDHTLTNEELGAVNILLEEYVNMLCLRERVSMNIPIQMDEFPKMLYEIEMELTEIRLILNTFLLDNH